MRGWWASACAAARRSASGARPWVSFSGLPGVTSHHTRSRLSRCSANRQAARCAACAGSNVPPNSPMRMPGAFGGRTMRSRIPALAAARREGACSLVMTFGKNPLPTHPLPTPLASLRDQRADLSRPRLSAAADAVLETGELFDADGAARMQPAGGDADLGAEAELAAVGKLRRRVVQHDRRIHFAQEFFRRGFVLGDDRVGVMRAVALDMVYRRIDAIDHTCGDDGVEIFGAPIGFACRLDSAVDRLDRGIAANLATGFDQHGDQGF